MFASPSWGILQGGPVVRFLSLCFIHVVADGDSARQLRAGRRAGPFTLTSDLLPRAVRVEVRASPLERSPGQAPLGEQLRLLSRWANAKVLELDTHDRRVKYLTTIGPKVHPEANTLLSLRQELAYVSGLEEFTALGLGLVASDEDITADTLRQRLSKLQASTPTQAAFLQSLLWRLDELK